MSNEELASEVAVIIPTCDRQQLVLEAIESVIAQELQPREIIVVDNGEVSVDRSSLPPQVQLFRLRPKVGPSRARNFGAAMSKAHLLAFLDDDDRWAPSFLSEAHALLQSEGLKCVYGRKDIFTSNGCRQYKLISPDTLSVSALLRRNPGTGGMNLLIDRQLYFAIGGFDERLRISEDRALALEIILAGEKIGVAPRAVALVRDHDCDRLRQRHLRKLNFVCKYWRHFSAGALVTSVLRIIARASAASALRRVQSLRARLWTAAEPSEEAVQGPTSRAA